MPHLELEAMRRILGGEGDAWAAEEAADHLVACDRCRAQAGTLIDELRVARPGLRGEGPLRLVFDMIDRERRREEEDLAALAQRTELRRMASRKSQRDRVRMAKAYHTMAFFRLVMSEIKEASAWQEAEHLAALAIASVDGMSQRNLAGTSACDLKAEVWTAVANTRRKAAEWKRMHQALADAEKFLKQGTGDRHLEASFLSIKASALADEGQVSKALETLERCRAIYESLSEGTLAARTLVKMTHILQPIEPAKGLMVLDRAVPLIPAEDPYLTLFSEMLRTECLIGVGKPKEAWHIFRRASPLLAASPGIRTRVRGMFTCARLLDALGYRPQAEQVFDEVVGRDIEHELYKDAFLDLLYLYGHHVKAGNLEKATRVCQRALTDPSLAEASHDQLRDLWSNLLEAARHQAVSPDRLKDLRQYLNTHWKHPAPTPPAVALR
jgi:tetratricopeptide (TPR) repeat protein